MSEIVKTKSRDTVLVEGLVKKVKTYVEEGTLELPKNYNFYNSVRYAVLMLKEKTAKINGTDQSLLAGCTIESMQRAVYRMVIEGLSPSREQCYFIATSTGICQLRRSYQGAKVAAINVGKLKDITGVCIYKKDIFKYSLEKGRYRIIEHTPCKLEDRNEADIIGAYAYVILQDGTEYIVLKTIQQIHAAWKMGYGETKANINFKEEMAIKTVISVACKPLINGSPDNVSSTDQEVEDAAEKDAKELANEFTPFAEILDNDAEVILNQSENLREENNANKVEPIHIDPQPTKDERKDKTGEEKDKKLFEDQPPY